MDQQIELKLTVAEVNTVLGALAQLPYAQVAKLVNDIKVQAQPQVSEPVVEDNTEE